MIIPDHIPCYGDRRYYVYFHYRHSDGEIFYVGKGCGSRITEYSSRNVRWKRTAKKHGWNSFKFWENLPNECAYTIERIMIHLFKSNGNRLVNLSNGGKGPEGIVHSEETRRSISEKNRGRKRHPDAIERTAAAHKGMKRSEETCKRIGERSKGRKFSDESRKKMSESQKSRDKSSWARGFVSARRDKTIYTFSDGESYFVGTRREFLEMTSGNTTSFHQLLTRPDKVYKGWRLIRDTDIRD